jgi:hypothetical protein
MTNVPPRKRLASLHCVGRLTSCSAPRPPLASTEVQQRREQLFKACKQSAQEQGCETSQAWVQEMQIMCGSR